MATLNPVHKDIIFQFVEKVSIRGNFREETDWGFVIKEDSKVGGNEHKMAVIKATGPECKVVKPGMTVVVESLQWTKQFIIGSQQYWKTDESKILAIIDDV